MSENSTLGRWNEQWKQAQRAYWEAWRSAMKFSPSEGNGTAPANLWSQALESWWKTMSGGLEGDGQAVFNRMVEQGKAYFQLGQQMTDLFRAISDNTSAGEQWKEVLKSRFDEMKASMSMEKSSQWATSMKGLSAFYEMPLDTWRRMLSGATMLPGDFMQTLRSQVLEGLGERFHADVDKFLSVPGVGYTREGQEQMQLMAKLLLDYQKALQEYADAHAKLAPAVLDLLYTKIVALTEKGEKITSLRQMYDLWVDSSEEIYGKFVMSAAFQEVYGRMVNALMRLKLQARNMIDEVLGALNMPTRTEMNTILKRQHELRREVRAMQRNLDGPGTAPRGGRNRSEAEDGELKALRSEVASLREQLATLQSELGARDAVVATKDQDAAPVTSVRRPRRTPHLRAVDTEAPAKPARSVPKNKPSPARTAAKWDIASIVQDKEGQDRESTHRGGGTKR